jgi:hypothetical protein
MTKHYFKIKEALIDEDLNIDEDLLLTSTENGRLRRANIHFEKMNSVFLELQKVGIKINEVRSMFDQVIGDYPSMELFLGATGHLVVNADFEAVVVTILNGGAITADAYLLIADIFKKDIVDLTSVAGGSLVQPISYAAILLRVGKKARLDTYGAEYQEPTYLPPTSVTCERAFSESKHILTPTCKSMSPILFEAILFLRKNRDLWDEKMVMQAAARKPKEESLLDDDDNYYEV